MNPFFAYLIKSSVGIALFYIVFKLAVSRDKMHSVNRFVLLGILVVSAILPFADIPVFQENPVIPKVEVFREFVATPVFNTAPISENVQSSPETKRVHINPYLIFYIFIISVLFIRLLVSTIRVMQIINGAEKRRFRKIVLAVVKDFIQPFTFLKHIIISEKDFTENKEIIVAHEYAHIKQLHAIDLIICEMFTALHWFNPFMWFLRRDLKLIHEFQADQAVLNKGIDATKYQLLVLEKSVGERRFAMANYFSQKPILKRLKMMQKKKKRFYGLKMILFVPAFAFLLMAFGKTGENVLEKENEYERTIEQSKTVQKSIEYAGFSIEVRKDGNYIDNKSCTLDEVVNKAKAWQKTGREDILLILADSISLSRVDEVREALRKAKVYHVNQSTVNSDEIIYPAGDVSSLATFTQGKWDEWMRNQLKLHMKDIPDDLEYKIMIGFIIDKNGKVRDARIVKGCDYPEINEAYKKVLAIIPDWKPAIKYGVAVSVLYTAMNGRRVKRK